MTAILSVRIPEELKSRLDTLAVATRRSKSVYVVEALERTLTQIEWEQQILENVAEIRSGRRRTYSTEEVKHELGLDD
jgi:RHH-type rel operon transcriptional repressor/antitoxin RelB